MLGITANNWWVLVTALAAGAVGGLTAALILLDPSETQAGLPPGTNPWKVVGVRTLVGAVAATAFLFFFPVSQTTTVGSGGHIVSTTTYPFLTVVALGLVVGTGGSAFLSAMRDKATSMITATKAQGQTAAMKQTAIAGMRPLVSMASSITRVGASSIAAQTSGVADEQFLTLADRLPPPLGDLRGKDSAAVNEAIVNATGRTFEVADPTVAQRKVAETIGTLPDQLAGDVQTALENHVDQVIAQLNQIG
jgi:hypothetical protein